jgi:hypothetical protein
MMLGLPQMQGSDLDDTVRAPLTFRFTGAAVSGWTVHRRDPHGGLVVSAWRLGRIRMAAWS